MARVGRSLAFVIVAALSVTAVAYGQQSGPLRYTGRSLAEALTDLQSRGLKIIYSSEVVRADMRVATEPRAASPRRILDELLTPLGLIAQDGPAGSVLVVKNPRVRAEPKRPLPKSTSTASASAATAGADVETPRFVETVDVTASQSWGAGVGTPSFVLQPLDVRSLAGGFDNIFRTLQALPGIAATDELGSRIAVRGGAPDQNLTIFDGVEIHNPYRMYVPSEDLGLAGLASAFNIDTIESIELSSGAFDVRHGDRLSSLLIIKSREGSSAEALQGSSFLNLTDANVTLEGRLPKRAPGSWLVSARRTHLDLIAQRVIGGSLPSFHDLHAKATWHPLAGQRLSFVGLTGKERIRADEGREAEDEVHATHTSNHLLAFTFESTLGRRSSSRTVASLSRFNDAFGVYERSLTNSRAANTEASITTGGPMEFQLARDVTVSDLALRQEIAVRPSERHAVDLGFETHWFDSRWAWRITGDRSLSQANGTSVRLGAGLPATLDSSLDSNRVGAWVQDRFQITPRLVIQPGLRLDWSSLTRQSTVSPRVSAAVNVSPALRLTAAVRLHSQSPGFEKLFQSDYFVDLSAADAPPLKAERALHAVGGVQRVLGRGVTAHVEAYFRRFSDLIVGRLETDAERRTRLGGYDVPTSLEISVPTRAEITTSPVNAATGTAHGLELHVARYGDSASRLTGWGSYAFNRAERTVYGVTHPFDYDRRHALSVAGNWKMGPRMDLSATARWATGFPRTPVRGVRLALVPDAGDIDGDGNPDEWLPQRDALGNPLFQPDRGGLSNLNAGRLPHFARVDARFTYRPTWSRERWTFYVDVINVLNKKNVPLFDSALVLDPRSERPGIIELPENSGIPFFPSFGIRFWF